MTDVEQLSAAKRALLERALARRRAAAAAAATAIPRRTQPGPAPLSYSQQRMWFLQQWEPQAPTFNGARAFRLRGALDREALARGLRTVIERHESLRTVVIPGREPLQTAPEDWSFELQVVERDGALDEQLRALSRRPFDLTADLMLRATLIELEPEEHVLLIGMHHIAADAHSDRVLFTELSELYGSALAGRPPQLAELPIQYADYAVWQRQRLQGTLLEELTAYWAAHLEGSPALLKLPTDRPRPAVQRHEGAHHRMRFERELGEQLLAVGREAGVTFYITMLAAFSTLLYLLSGEEDIVIGSPIASRNHTELEGLIGFFTNTLALRTRLRGNPSFREVMARARESALGAYAHQELPFEKVVEALRPKRDPSYNPLFQVNFRAQEAQRPPLVLPGLEIEPLAVDIGFSRFDFALELELRADALAGYFEYDRDLFDAETVAGFEDDLRALLDQIVRDPDVQVLAIQLPHGRRGRRRTTGTIGRRMAK
ncbi:MAG TPA: condensation domain-containing protein [Solirubrobacteraceae bacterium]|nr:condensation domain-containing protein [Solirubrobacteraceae bacterium]